MQMHLLHPPGYGPALLSQKKKLLIGTRNSFHTNPPEEAYFRELDFAVFCIKHITLLFGNGLLNCNFRQLKTSSSI